VIVNVRDKEASMTIQAYECRAARREQVAVASIPAMGGEIVLGGEEVVGGSVSRAPRHLRVVREDERVARPGLRLTRRGRLVRTLLVFGALSLLSLVLAARWAAPDLPPTHSVTVREGQSLSQIAEQELPMIPAQAAALRIRLANGMSSSVVMSGQSLVIPGDQ